MIQRNSPQNNRLSTETISFRSFASVLLAVFAVITSELFASQNLFGQTPTVQNSNSVQNQHVWVSTLNYGPFLIRTDFDIKQVQPLLNEIRLLDQELSRRFTLQPAPNPIELYIFTDLAAYDQYIQKVYPGAPRRRALFAMSPDQPCQVFLHRNKELAIDLRHECTHALLHCRIRNLPIWLDEGLAEYFEVPAEQRITKQPYYKSIKFNLWFGIVPNMKKLEAIRTITRFTETDYRNSWALVNYMLSDPALERYIARYMAQCDQKLRNIDQETIDSGKHPYPSFWDGLIALRPKFKSDYRAWWKQQ